MLRHQLSKNERIYLRSEIQQLFASRGSFVCYPFRVIYQLVPYQTSSARILISVPKRKLKHAVMRNRIKRLTREAYRLHKELLCEKIPAGQTLLLGFIYLDGQLKQYSSIENAVCGALSKLSLLYDEALPID